MRGLRRLPVRCSARSLPASMQPSDVKTLAAAAFALGFRVLELEGLIQALLDEINQSAVDQRQTQGIDHDFHAARFENRIFRMNLLVIIHDIGESRAAGLLDSDTQSDAGSALRQVRSNPVSRRFRQQYRHTAPPSRYDPICGRCAINNTPGTRTHGTRARFSQHLTYGVGRASYNGREPALGSIALRNPWRQPGFFSK